MFKDYYAILEVGESVTQEEIKSAFKRQALKWHPDRNHGVDTTQQMQEINEAYLILKDNEARDRYNREYQRFKQYQQERELRHQKSYQEKKEPEQHYQRSNKEGKQKERANEYSDYNVYDDVLNKWMNNAKQQAVDLAKLTIEDLKGMVSVGVKIAAKEAGNQFIYQIIISVVLLLIIALTKSCSN